MAGLSDTAESRTLAHLLGVSATPSPVATYIILYNNAPTDSGGGVLIDDALPQRIRWSVPSLDPVISSNTNTLIWTAPSVWGEVGGWAILDSNAGAANIIFYGEFENPETVGLADQFSIASGDIVLGLD